jgi:hypothetical protein
MSERVEMNAAAEERKAKLRQEEVGGCCSSSSSSQQRVVEFFAAFMPLWLLAGMSAKRSCARKTHQGASAHLSAVHCVGQLPSRCAHVWFEIKVLTDEGCREPVLLHNLLTHMHVI